MKMPLRCIIITMTLALLAGCANRSSYYSPSPEPPTQPAPVVQPTTPAEPAKPAAPPEPKAEPGLTMVTAEEMPPKLAEWAAIQKQEGAREPQVRSEFVDGVLYIAVSGGERPAPGYTLTRRRSHTRTIEPGTLLVLDVAITPPREGAPAQGSRTPQAFFKWTGGQYFTLNWIDESHWAEKPAPADLPFTAALRWEAAMYAYLEVYGTASAPGVEVALYDGDQRLEQVQGAVSNGRFMVSLGFNLPEPGHTVVVTVPGSEPARLTVPERMVGAYSNNSFPQFTARVPGGRTVEVWGQSQTTEPVSLVVMVNGQEAVRKDGLRLNGEFRENIQAPSDLPIDGVEVWAYTSDRLVLVEGHVYHGK